MGVAPYRWSSTAIARTARTTPNAQERLALIAHTAKTFRKKNIVSPRDCKTQDYATTRRVPPRQRH